MIATATTINRKELSGALAALNRVAGRRRASSILDCVRFAAGASGELELTATDLELAAVWRFPGVAGPERGFCASLRELAKRVKGKVPEVELEVDDAAGMVHVRVGAVASTLVASSAGEFPELPALGEPFAGASIDVGVVAKLCRETAYAVSRDETRYCLNGVYVERDGESGLLRWVAIDGHRLAVSSCPDESIDFPFPASGAGVVVPIRFVEELGELARAKRPLAGEFEFRARYSAAESGTSSPAGLLSATLGPATLTARPIEGEFPNYRQVIPERGDRRVDVDRGELAEALASLAPMAPITGAIRVRIDDAGLALATSDPDRGEASCGVPAEPSASAVGLELGVSGRYLREVLAATDARRVRLWFGSRGSGTVDDGSFSPIRVEAEGSSSLAVVAPVRL